MAWYSIVRFISSMLARAAAKAFSSASAKVSTVFAPACIAVLNESRRCLKGQTAGDNEGSAFIDAVEPAVTLTSPQKDSARARTFGTGWARSLHQAMYRPAHSGLSKMVVLPSCTLVPMRTAVVFEAGVIVIAERERCRDDLGHCYGSVCARSNR